MASLCMEIAKNVICVIKKYSAENILEHLNLQPLSEICISKANIFQKFLLCLFCFYLRNKFFFLGIEKHGLVLKLLCVEQLQIACKFASAWKWHCWQLIWMHCHGSTKKACFNFHNKLKRKKIECLWLSSGGNFSKLLKAVCCWF